MKLLVLSLLILLASCQCKDADMLDHYNKELDRIEHDMKYLAPQLDTALFQSDPAAFYILEDELTDLILEKAVTEIDIEVLKRDSDCL